jgi:hypothetical protein
MAGFIGKTSVIPSIEGNVFRTVTIFESGSGTYTPPATAKDLKITAVGGGGSGGGSAVSAVGRGAAGSGGGAGGTVIKYIRGIDPATYSFTYTVGAGGVGAAGGVEDGTAGTSTTCDDGSILLTAGGGGFGVRTSVGTTLSDSRQGANGGIATGGDINIPGGDGVACFFDGVTSTNSTVMNAIGGNGGGSTFGSGGRGARTRNTTAEGMNGDNGEAYGSGGGGSATIESGATGNSGGNGAPGIIIVEEYHVLSSNQDTNFTPFIASQSDAEAGTNNTLLMTPLRSADHNLASQQTAKAWIYFTGNVTTPAPSTNSYNMSSITDSGVGLYIPTFTNNMNGADYAVITGYQIAAGQSHLRTVNYTSSNYSLVGQSTASTAADTAETSISNMGVLA